MAKTIVGVNIRAALKELADNLGDGGAVKVGFLENSTYESNGKTVSVPMVAAIQNYGAPAVGIPPRPFFTNFIKDNSPNWGKLFSIALKDANYNVKQALGIAGDTMRGELQESIANLYSPKLSEVTLLLRQMKSEGGPNFVVNRTVVNEARKRVAAGERASGVSTKPLVDSGHMLESVDFEVNSK